jgi:hypothetical protein
MSKEAGELLTIKERVIKLRNSKNRYLKIPENQFPNIIHNDTAEIMKKKTDEHTYLIYKFKNKK